MAVVTKTIGTSSRDYSTIASWIAALPANLVTAGDSHIGATYNDSQFIEIGLSLSGHTTDASHTILFTAAAGQSFQDNVNIQTNELRSNQANGVEFLNNGGYAGTHLLTIGDLNVTVSRIQFRNTAGRGLFQASDGIARSCILEASSWPMFKGTLWANCLGLVSTDAQAVAAETTTTTLANCTIVKPVSAAGSQQALSTGYGAVFSGKNVAVFGFPSVMTSQGSSTFTNCMTDVASPPTGFTGSKTYANQFQDTGTTFANRDFRMKAGADLQNAGTTDTTDIPASDDIAKTTRPQGASWDIGAWELVVAGGFFTPAAMSGLGSGGHFFSDRLAG